MARNTSGSVAKRAGGAVLLLAGSFVTGSVFAAPPDDLQAGQALVQQGEFEAALKPLTAAAQGLPESVEAQLALADCFLRLGQLDQALAKYRAVLALSPEHAQAKRMAEALEGREATAEQRLETARALIAQEVYSQAEAQLTDLLREPLADEKRAEAELLRVEARLWSGNADGALAESLRLIAEAKGGGVGQARVLAALAAIGGSGQAERATTLLEGAGELPSPWKERAALAAALAKLDGEVAKDQQAAWAQEISSAMGAGVGSVPSGQYRDQLVMRAYARLQPVAQSLANRGEIDRALEVVWPMIAGGAAPAEGAAAKSAEPLSGGWVESGFRDANQKLGHVDGVAHLLWTIGRAEVARRGPAASFVGYALAARTWLTQISEGQMQHDRYAPQLTSLLQELGGLSRVAAARKAGETLSPADDLQRTLVLAFLSAAADDPWRSQAVQIAIAHIDRYRQAGDLETGLKQFLSIDADEAAKVTLDPSIEAMPLQESRFQILFALAQAAAELGEKEFHKQAASLAASANETVNLYDRAAFQLAGRASHEFPAHGEAATLAQNMAERYFAARRYDAAEAALALFYAPLPPEKRQWALIHAKIRRVRQAEDQAIAANRKLPEKLDESLAAALGEAAKLVAANPDKATRATAIGIAQPLVDYYAGQRRDDLAEQVIVAVSGDAQKVAAADAAPDQPAPDQPVEGETASPLADWATWARATLLARRASEAVAIAARQAGPGKPLALAELHAKEIALLGELLARFPESDYRQAAVDRVLTIADVYQNLSSFDTALAVVRDFLAANGTLSAGPRLAYREVQISLAKAASAFQRRLEPQTPPAKLSDEYAAAIEAIAAFLKANPTSDYAPAAEADLFSVMRVYGEANAWPVAREVLARFAQAAPEYRQPSWLRLLEAATWLGELDRAYALGLLTPRPMAANDADGDGKDDASGQHISAIASIEMPATPPTANAPGEIGMPQAGFAPAVGGPEGGVAMGGGAGGMFGGGFAESIDTAYAREPNATALAMIAQSQQRQYQQLAMLEQDFQQVAQQQANAAPQAAIQLPTGGLLSQAEMKRQDEAADAAYAILIELAKNGELDEAAVAEIARRQVLWLFGFFEGQRRPGRSIALIERFLKDSPNDPARIALAYQAASNSIEEAALVQANDKVDMPWLNRRHEIFELARAKIRVFVAERAADEPADRTWADQARLLLVASFDRESQLAQQVSAVRAGGLLVQSAEALLELLKSAPKQAEQATIPERLWGLADRLQALGQETQAIYVLGKLPLEFPVHPLANQAVLRVAQLHAAHLANPLKAVETFQEYLGLAGDDEQVRAQIFAIGQELSQKQRYLESLHVFGVFVDSFPSDPRAAEAIRSIGQIHQANEAWTEAIAAYRRILDEFPGQPIGPDVKLAIAECQINLSDWRTARRLYEEYLAQHGGEAQAGMAQQRLAVLKNLERFQNLLADKEVMRNKDDAQFQIGRIVLEQLQNHVKAAAEFRKVVENFPKSDLADDAQLEIGKAFLALGRHEDAREELAKVPEIHAGSPVADDALYLIGQSFERQAESLTAVTVDGAKAEAWVRNQRGAYRDFNRALAVQSQVANERREGLKKAGKSAELALDEASNAFRFNAANADGLSNTLKQAEQQAETESALQVANRQDRINEAYRDAVEAYAKAAADYPLGDNTDDALLRIAQVQEQQLNDRAAAMATYQNIVRLFPGTPVAEDAAWNVAQFYEQEGKYAAAVTAYREFIRTYPASGRVADSQFALAEMHEQLGQWVDAMDAYETFRQKFAQHPKASLAAEQITWIKAYRK